MAGILLGSTDLANGEMSVIGKRLFEARDFLKALNVALAMIRSVRDLGLIRFRGHFPKGGYDVHTDGRDPQESRRPRRRFDDDFKAQAVRLVLDEGKSVGAVARDLDLTETALREWVQRARANRTRGRTGLTTAEREELAQLRKENRQLRLEREILKNAAAFFAKEPATRSR